MMSLRSSYILLEKDIILACSMFHYHPDHTVNTNKT